MGNYVRMPSKILGVTLAPTGISDIYPCPNLHVLGLRFILN